VATAIFRFDRSNSLHTGCRSNSHRVRRTGKILQLNMTSFLFFYFWLIFFARLIDSALTSNYSLILYIQVLVQTSLGLVLNEIFQQLT